MSKYLKKMVLILINEPETIDFMLKLIQLVLDDEGWCLLIFLIKKRNLFNAKDFSSNTAIAQLLFQDEKSNCKEFFPQYKIEKIMFLKF